MNNLHLLSMRSFTLRTVSVMGTRHHCRVSVILPICGFVLPHGGIHGVDLTGQTILQNKHPRRNGIIWNTKGTRKGQTRLLILTRFAKELRRAGLLQGGVRHPCKRFVSFLRDDPASSRPP